MRQLYFLPFLLLMIGCSLNSSAQKQPAHTYYIYVNNGLTRADVLSVEKKIRSHTETDYFGSVDFPVKYFVLKTNMPLKESLFRTWLGPMYTIRFFGEKGAELERFQQKLKTAKQR